MYAYSSSKNRARRLEPKTRSATTTIKAAFHARLLSKRADFAGVGCFKAGVIPESESKVEQFSG
jgi:hypothetical protein